MKKTKRIFAIFMSLAMILSMCFAMSITAFAATGEQTLDGSISVSGLQAGDKVDFYRVLKFDSDAANTKGWVADTGFTDLTEAQIKQMLSIDLAAGATGGITEALAGQIGDMAESASVKYGESTTPAVAISGDTATVTKPDAGLYVAIIHPGKAGVIYNPVFVGADYKATPATNTWSLTEDASYSPATMAKKATIPVEKKAKTAEEVYEDNKAETVAIGDTVSFSVKTKIPEFADNYTKAVFKITDTLSAGLELKTGTVKVYAAADDQDKTKLLAATSGTTKTYTLTETATGYVINFDKDYLLGLDAAQDIFVTYDATVTSTAPYSVNILDNTVDVNFSNTPTDETGRGLLRDETKHYTFDIDANLLGEETYKATEVVKVGVDKDGNEITKTTVLDNGKTIGALEGAEFKLYTAESCTDAVEYKGNDIFKNGAVIESDGNGRLTVKGQATPGIRGLDAGTYYLKETKAPDGYIKAQDPVKIEIIPKFKEVEKTEKVNGIDVTWKYNELESYEIKIGGTTTATYTMTNEKPNKGDTVVGTDDTSGKIKNPQGVELPSTGGIGTIIFYTLGTLLVVGCGIVLVSRRRMQKNR